MSRRRLIGCESCGAEHVDESAPHEAALCEDCRPPRPAEWVVDDEGPTLQEAVGTPWLPRGGV